MRKQIQRRPAQGRWQTACAVAKQASGGTLGLLVQTSSGFVSTKYCVELHLSALPHTQPPIAGAAVQNAVMERQATHGVSRPSSGLWLLLAFEYYLRRWCNSQHPPVCSPTKHITPHVVCGQHCCHRHTAIARCTSNGLEAFPQPAEHTDAAGYGRNKQHLVLGTPCYATCRIRGRAAASHFFGVEHPESCEVAVNVAVSDGRGSVFSHHAACIDDVETVGGGNTAGWETGSTVCSRWRVQIGVYLELGTWVLDPCCCLGCRLHMNVVNTLTRTQALPRAHMAGSRTWFMWSTTMEPSVMQHATQLCDGRKHNPFGATSLPAIVGCSCARSAMLAKVRLVTVHFWRYFAAQSASPGGAANGDAGTTPGQVAVVVFHSHTREPCAMHTRPR